MLSAAKNVPTHGQDSRVYDTEPSTSPMANNHVDPSKINGAALADKSIMCHKKTELCAACGFDAAAKITKCKDAPEDIHKCKNFKEELVEGNNHCNVCADDIPGGIPPCARF
ncbi:hypothetical protein HYE67_002124 [Fusarium culmorum]|uniref:Uncharacterized protein n=1 Tax=Fusarium culmorum TaxID=5516 RepID=A0A2T4GUD0_FUSCU|nr:hypothetical protein FCULG_00006325 [Fusarium culmorum]QPC59893.1 hypothetical protein HYE67_002124 [Fusarium culmorum]